MSGVILDASSLLALLRGEEGADRVAEVLVGAAITTVNLCEVIGILARDGFSRSDIRTMLDGLRAERVAFDSDLAFEAGLLLPLTRAAGLSLGDRACLALALQRRAPALTADRAWSRIADAVGVEVAVIR